MSGLAREECIEAMLSGLQPALALVVVSTLIPCLTKIPYRRALRTQFDDVLSRKRGRHLGKCAWLLLVVLNHIQAR